MNPSTADRHFHPYTYSVYCHSVWCVCWAGCAVRDRSPSPPFTGRTGEGVGGGLTTEVGYRGYRLPRGPLSSCSGYHGEWKWCQRQLAFLFWPGPLPPDGLPQCTAQCCPPAAWTALLDRHGQACWPCQAKSLNLSINYNVSLSISLDRCGSLWPYVRGHLCSHI